MLFRIDPSAAQDLYQQIAAQVRAAIATGRLTDGDRLPPARELAHALDVNMHTVLRAYSGLRDEGVIEMRRGRGVTVRSDGKGRARLMKLARELATEAHRQGVSATEAARLVKEAM